MQYESGRADGLRKLKPYAIPTQFIFTPPSLPGRPTKRKRIEERPSFGGQEHVQLDHSYYSDAASCSAPLASCSVSLEDQSG